MISPRYLIYHDLIGFRTSIKSKNSHGRFIDCGIIIDETKNLVIVEKDNKNKKYLKKDYLFRLKIEGLTLEVDGNKIIGVPENRLRTLKKKKR